MKIRLIGQANHTGIGRHFQEFSRAAKIHRPDWPWCQVDPFHEHDLRAAIEHSQATDINICFTGHLIPGLQGRMIQWVPFESTRIPELLREPLAVADEIWCMTAWAQSCLIKEGFDAHKIVIMPQGVDTQFASSRASVTDVTRFLMVAKYEQRKGIIEAIQAWASVFADDPRYLLTIKSHGVAHDQSEFDQLHQLILGHGITNFCLIWGVMSDADLLDLYRTSQVFLSPTYAEGWGRPIMEAAAVGMPIITTKYSAHGEWLSSIQDSVIWVDHDLVTIRDNHYERAYGGQQDWGVWAKPRVSSLIDALREVSQNLARYEIAAAANSESIHDRYSWSKVVDLVSARFDEFD